MPAEVLTSVRTRGPERDGTRRLPRLAIVVEPRFPGGTATAVAAEIRALAPVLDLEVAAIETGMFHGRPANPAILEAVEDTGIGVSWNPVVVRADVIVLHNPACLKFDTALPVRLSCETAIVVTHENFLRPGGAEGFDVGHCLDLIGDRLVCGSRWLAPVSPVNRRGVESWLRKAQVDWTLAPFDWFNVCDMPLRPPTATPRDRRGRHSRPGVEKFPAMEAMLRHFPAHAERAVILGGDHFLLEPETIPPHWDVRRFGAIDVGRFLAEIDFFVYFTNPQWCESFGRVIAEAIAAGKVVITDPGTAEAFGPAVVRSDGQDVDRIIADLIAAPARYAETVGAAQDWLSRRDSAKFRAQVVPSIAQLDRLAHALL